MSLPQKFLCRWELQLGALVYGVIMLIIHIANCIAAIYQVVVMKECFECGVFAWRNAYSMAIVTCFYCFIMLAITIWFLWGVRREKRTVVLVWLAFTGLFLFQGTALLIVLVCLYHSQVGLIAWLVAFFFALVGVGICIYLFLVTLSYWLQLREAAMPQ